MQFKKFKQITLAAISLTLLTCGLAKIPNDILPTFKNIQARSSKNDTNNPTFLFNVSSADGSIKLDKKQHYILSIRLPDMEQVLMYSDRPNRIVKYITGANLAKFWVAGDNSFKVNPPNAILSTESIRPTVVVLHDIKVNGTYAVFDMTSTRHLHIGKLNHVSLNIDGTNGCGWCFTSIP